MVSIVLRRVRPDAVEADLRGLAPAAEERQAAAAVEDARCEELDLGAFVAGDGVAAARVDRVVAADVVVVARAQREAAARIGTREERMPLQPAARDEGVEPVENPLALDRDVGMQRRNFRGLLLLDCRLPRSRRRLLRLRRGHFGGGACLASCSAAGLGGFGWRLRCLGESRRREATTDRRSNRCEQPKEQVRTYDQPSEAPPFPALGATGTP